VPFNANTYYYNRDRKKAYAYIAQAKDIKARAKTGSAYAFEINRIPSLVKLARNEMHIALGWRRIAEMTPKKPKRLRKAR
jgi:hypothetical protein